MPARLLIEARPGAGKTTALSRLAERLADAGVSLVKLTRSNPDGLPEELLNLLRGPG
jgi:nucleoside-triphosphatase THEP1